MQHISKIVTTLAVVVGAAASGPASAWDMYVESELYDNGGAGLSFIDASGGYSVTSTAIGVRGDIGTSSGIPVNYQTHTADSGTWSDSDDWGSGPFAQTPIPDSTGNASANINFYDEPVSQDMTPDYATASIFGPVRPGLGVAAGWYYDYTLTLDPGASVTVSLAGYGSVLRDSGDTGTGFGRLSLFDPTVDINDPGGTNNPYTAHYLSTQAGQTSEFYNSDPLTYTFENTTTNPVPYFLRAEGTVAAYAAPVPEPQTVLMMLAGLGIIGACIRRRTVPTA